MRPAMGLLLGAVVVVAAALLAVMLFRGSGDGEGPNPWVVQLNAAGFRATAASVHLPGRTGLRRAALVQIEGLQQRLLLEQYDSEPLARQGLAKSVVSPGLAMPMQRGVFVLLMPEWRSDDPQTQRVRAAFEAFDVDAAIRPRKAE